MSQSTSENQFLTVAELVDRLNILFDTQLGLIRFEGEISQVQRAQSGHLYYSVKDAKAQISCAMWASSTRTLTFKPEPGVFVQCFGKANVYPPSGRFQVVVQKMVQAGEGLLQKKFLELKAQLEKEGFFSQDRKRVLPVFPRGVGIATSRTGAVIHDMMVKLKERMPNLPVYLAECRVQGAGAAEEIARAVELLDASHLVDVIIVARGGGSLEDLWAFNEARVVKAVFAAKVPVISGVGHEVDVTLCDLAADVRAPTPTAAAEMVVPKRADLLTYLSDSERRLKVVLRDFEVSVQRVDEMELRFARRIKSIFDQARIRLHGAYSRVDLLRPDARIARIKGRLDLAGQKLNSVIQKRTDAQKPNLERSFVRLSNAVNQRITKSDALLSRFSARLTALNPLAVLSRGYSIVEKGDTIVRKVSELKSGDDVRVRISDGNIDMRVK